MKSTFFTLLCFYTLISSGQLMTLEGNQWNVESLLTATTYTLRLKGDTIFNNLVYKKFQFSFDPELSEWRDYGSYIREYNQKIFIKAGNDQEILFYDFSLSLGDTFSINPGCRGIVVGSDTITLNNGEKRKRLKVIDRDTFYYNEWIEGIGSRGGPYFTFWRDCMDSWTDLLLCFYANTELLFPANPPYCFFVSANEINLSLKLKLSPNPTTTSLTLQIPENLQAESFRIVNTAGLALKTQKIKTGEKTVEIDTARLPSGIYFLQLRAESGAVFTERFVVRR